MSKALLPALPDPTTATIERLHAISDEAAEWAAGCDDVEEAVEAWHKIAAIEEYLSRKKQAGPAQTAARLLEVRIGQLLGPAERGRPEKSTSDGTFLPRNRTYEFRKMAAHADVVRANNPVTRKRALQLIQAAEAEPAGEVIPTDSGAEDEVGPNGFRSVVIDPPWRYDNVATRGAAEDHYPTMTLDELAKLEVPAADDSHLYLWVTNSFIRAGFDLLDAWDFTYKTTLTWCKPSIGMGNYFRNNTEHVLFAVRGKLATQRNDVGTWFQAGKTRHSAKPESFYDLVESCSPGPYLEMFARRRRFGWHVWGNEA